jgi:YHS domain-containing protein
MNKLSKIMAVMLVATIASYAGMKKPELNGYCIVAYSVDKALMGSEQHMSEYKGKSYYFVNGDAKKAFDKTPDKFIKAVQYKAVCATGVALGKKIEANPEIFTKVGEKVYLFSNADAKAMFDKNQGEMIKKADANWKKVNGNPDKLK